MSAASSLRRAPTAGTITTQHISLIDHERPGGADDAERDLYSDPPTAPPTPGPAPLTKKLTANSLQLQQTIKRELTRRKYAKYNRDRYKINDTSNSGTEDVNFDDHPRVAELSGQIQPGQPATVRQTSYLERSKAAASQLLKRKRTLGAGTHTSDTALDILYENQRGLFLFGIPKYSASSLLPSDPKPWQNAQFRTSPVDIRNAQPPDPSWEWAWKSWYVDMSRDVDEEGWEYSLQFNGFAWHGSHPWFHSFVRRRRWVRLRRRKKDVHQTKEKAHELTAEYFTIHPDKGRRVAVEDVSQMAESELARLLREKEEEVVDVGKIEIADIGSLELALRKAALDREKLVVVRRFLQDGGEELVYLAERMEAIMGMFVFQSSRRQLLEELLRRYRETAERKESLAGHTHDDENAQKEHDSAQRKADNLIKAVHAADEQVKRLEYWSDIKGMAQKGRTLSDEDGGQWDAERWQGLMRPTNREDDHPLHPFESKQSADDGLRELPSHTQHDDDEDYGDKGKGVRGKESSVFWDAKTRDSSDEAQSAYLTAAESASELKRKQSGGIGKRRANAPTSLDGVLEDDDNVDAAAQTDEGAEIDPETGKTFMTPPEKPMSPGSGQVDELDSINATARDVGVQVVDPEPVPEADEQLPPPKLNQDEGGS